VINTTWTSGATTCPAIFRRITSRRFSPQCCSPAGHHIPRHLLALGPTYRERIYEVEYDGDAREEAAYLIAECRRFWGSLQGGEPPDLDDTVPTYDCLRQLHPEIDGSTVELDSDEALFYAQARVDFTAAEDALQREKNYLLKRMENSQYAEFGGKQIARRQASSKGGVALYASKTITPEQVRQLTEGNTDD
jgi:hypothetical protein